MYPYRKCKFIRKCNFDNCNYAVVGDYSNIMKTTFLFKFKLFYLFPVLNKDMYKDVVNKIHNGEELSSEDVTFINFIQKKY